MPVDIPYLKKDVVYRYKPTINEDRLPKFALPFGWEQSACREFSGLTKHFYGGGGIQYNYRENLRKSFSFFYAVLTDRVTLEGVEITPEFKQVIKEKINEEIANCSQGFHNRINSLYGLFFVPKTIEALLQSIRQSIIVNAITKVTEDVHRQNGILEQTRQFGYGIECANNKDDYGRRALSVVEANAVHNAFKEKFTWIHILAGLKEEIKALLSGTYGYHGRLSDAAFYDKGDYDSFRSYINELFGKDINEQAFFIFDDDAKVIDINWQLVSTELWHVVKNKLFNLPSYLSNSLEILFTSGNTEQHQEQQIKTCLANIRKYLNNKGELLSLMSLLPEIDKPLMIDELFNLLSSSYQPRDEYEYFLRNSGLESEAKHYAIAKFKEKYPRNYDDLKRQLSVSYGAHRLLDQYKMLDKDIAKTSFSFGLLLSEDRFEILNQRLSGGKTLLASILSYSYDNNFRTSTSDTNKQSAFSQKKASFINLIDGFSTEQLNHFFQRENYIALALQHERQSLVPLLTQLEKCDANTIASQFLSFIETKKIKSLFLALLNKNNVLTEKVSQVENKPLSKTEVGKVQKLAIALLNKLPEDFKNIFIPSDKSDHFIMSYLSFELTAEAGKDLFRQMDEKSISTLLATLPAQFETKHMAGLISLMEVAPVSLLMTIFQKNISYLEGLSIITKTCPLVRKLFFDKDAFPVLLKIFELAELQQKQKIVELIFSSKDTNDLTDFLEKHSAIFTYKEFKMFSSLLPRTIQFKQVKNAWCATQNNLSKIMPFLHGFTKEECMVLFERSISKFNISGITFRNTTLRDILEHDFEYHKTLAVYLKTVEIDEDRYWIIENLFSKNPAMFSRMVLNESSRELLNLFPATLIFSLFQLSVNKQLVTSKIYVKCVDFFPSLKKGKKLKDLEIKSRMERDAEKKQLLKQQIEYETQIDNARNIQQGHLLSELLLLTAPNQKTVFQNILECAPSKAFQLLHWADFFEKENIRQSYINHACNIAIEFDAENLILTEDLFDDLLKIVVRSPQILKLKNLSAMSLFISNAQSMQDFLGETEKMTASSIKHLFEKKTKHNQIEKTVLERVFDKENTFLLIEPVLNFIEKMKTEKNIVFKNVIDLNNCPGYFNLNLEQQLLIFQTIWNGGLCEQEALLKFLRSIDVVSFIKLKFLLLNFVGKHIGVNDLDFLVSYGASENSSLLKEAVIANECMDKFDWQSVFNQLSDNVTFGLLGSESYDDKKINLLEYLLQKKQYQSFFKIYEFVNARNTSTRKENFLKAEILFPADFKLLNVLSDSNMHAGVVAFYLSKEAKAFLHQIQYVEFNEDRDKNAFDAFCQNLIATEEGKNYFLALISDPYVTLPRSLFVKLVLNKHDGLFKKAFASFDLLTSENKLKLMRNIKTYVGDFYRQISENSTWNDWQPTYFSVEQKRTIKHHLSLLPYANWQEFGAQHAFFFDEYHLDKQRLISPYLFALKPYELDTLFNGVDVSNKTFTKVFDELDAKNSFTNSDFIRLLNEKIEPYSISKMLNFPRQNGYSFAVNYLASDPVDLSLFIECLGRLHVTQQQRFMSNYIQNLKYLKPDSTLLPYLELKLELLNLEIIKEEASNRINYSNYASQSGLVAILGELTDALNNAYNIAICSDSPGTQKSDTIDKVKQILCNSKTRDLINTHRGVKKIVLNILLAFAGLGIGYMVGCSVNYYLTKGKHFFYHPPTRTEGIVSKIAHRINAIDLPSRQ